MVALDLRGDEAVRSAARSLLALAKGQDPLLLVERMVRGSREFMIGMKRPIPSSAPSSSSASEGSSPKHTTTSRSA